MWELGEKVEKIPEGRRERERGGEGEEEEKSLDAIKKPFVAIRWHRQKRRKGGKTFL